jgi:predicted dehydrogenase
MTHKSISPNRRDFLRKSAAASTALAAMSVPRFAHAAGSDTLKVGLIGCGNRGSGAAVDAVTADPHARLVAIGDTFADLARQSLDAIKRAAPNPEQIAVADDHIFTGFDAYKQVIDSDVDVVLLATPPHFRPQHLKYAVEKGKHTFVEKPIAVDVPGVHSVIKTCAEAKQKNLAVVSGLCWRYTPHVKETIARVKDGAIGDIIAIESCYNGGRAWDRGESPEWSPMEYQVRNWLHFGWLSGDHIVEQAIHSLDKTAWLQDDSSPLRAWGLGGRQRNDVTFGNIFDHHTVFYEYPNNIRVFFTCRRQDGCNRHVDETVLGTKGRAQILKARIDGENPWRYRGKRPNKYVEEHIALFKSIRDGKPIDDSHYMCNSTLIAIMGRMCTYTGQELTWDKINSSQQRLGPEQYNWGDMPVAPVAVPGRTQFA